MINNFTRNLTTPVPFSKQNLLRVVSRFIEDYGPVNLRKHPQIQYIANYLEDSVKCKWIVHEKHYIDHDYMEAFASYYSKCLKPYPNYCQRLHFFNKNFKPSLVSTVLQEVCGIRDASKIKELASIKTLTESYLGFMVVRPQNQTFVGQTVISPLKKEEGRRFSCIRSYLVNLFGLNITINGLAFQQQDRGVSACATASIWFALNKTAFDEGFKIPSTMEITTLATRFNVEVGRTFPSTGLTRSQMCEAIRATGLEAELLLVAESPSLCRAVLHAYLKSGIPVIALMAIGRGNKKRRHAVTVVGYREPGTKTPKYKAKILATLKPANWVKLRGSAIPECYVHDDRIGPYAHIYFDDVKSSSRISRTRVIMEYKWMPKVIKEKAEIEALLIPVYPKIRLKYQTILKSTYVLLLDLASIVPELISRDDELEIFFQRGRNYKNEFSSINLPVQDRLNFLNITSFPRWVGVSRVFRGTKEMFDLLFDTTESDLGFPVLGLVLRNSNLLPLRLELRKTKWLFPTFP